MRFMVILRATSASEAGEMPSEATITAMGNYNESLVRAGVLLAAEGLHPSREGARVRFSGDTRDVIDGPFGDPRELVAGFWLMQVRSLDEAIEWVKRAPNPFEDGTSEIEIRRIFDADDFGPEFTVEARAQEERLRAEVAARSL